MWSTVIIFAGTICGPFVEYFGAEVAPYPGHEEPLAKRLPSVEGDWTKIVEKYGLRELPDRGGVPVLACRRRFLPAGGMRDRHEPKSGDRIPNESKYLGGVQSSILSSTSRENHPVTRNGRCVS